MKTFILLSLSFLLVILIKESHALTEEPVESLLESTTPVSVDEEETTTFSLAEIDSASPLDNSGNLMEDEETTTILSLEETTIGNEPESTTSPDVSSVTEELEDNTAPSVDENVEAAEEDTTSPNANIEKQLSSSYPKQGDLVERTNLPIKEVNNDSNLLSSKDLSKRILLEPPTESNPDPVNIDNLPKVQTDAWRPVWPYSNLETVSIRPTVRFPSIEVSQPTVESSLRSYPESEGSYTVSKEPVTAYYFDLSSVAPTKQVGPLFDPSYILENFTSTKVPNNNFPSRGTELSLGSSIDDLHSLTSNLEGNVNIPSLENVPIIEPTPIIPRPPSSFENEKISTIPAVEESSVIPEEGMTSLHNSKTTTVASLYSRTVTELQNPTPAYTLGGSSDFHFTNSERKNVNNATNISEPVILPSILSSDHLLESHSTTGDPSYKISESLNTASLFRIPINPSELPSPIFSTVVDRTQESTILTSTPVSRIPLWKRLSQKKPSTPISSQAPTLDPPSDKTVLISTTVETPVYSSVPFENDIPIGILSPGILKHPSRSSDTESNNKIYPNVNNFEFSPYAPDDLNDDEVEPTTTLPIVNSLITTPSLSETHSASASINPFPFRVYPETIPNSDDINLTKPLLDNSFSTSVKFVDSTTKTNLDDDEFWVNGFNDITANTTLKDFKELIPETVTPKLHSEFTPYFTSTRLSTYTADHTFDPSKLSPESTHKFDGAPTAQIQSVTDEPFTKKHFDLSDTVKSVVNTQSTLNLVPPSAPSVNEINTAGLLNNISAIETYENSEHFGEGVLVHSPVFNNLNSTFVDSFGNSSVKFTDSKIPPPANKTDEENFKSKDGEDASVNEEEGDFFITTPVNNVSGEAVQDPLKPLEEEGSGVPLVDTHTDEPFRPDSAVVIEKEKTSARPKTSTTKEPVSVLDPVSEVFSSTTSTSTSTTTPKTTTTTTTTSTTTTTASTTTSTTTSSTTTTPTTTTEPPPPPSLPPSTTTSTSTTTTEANIPDNLEWRPPTYESGANDMNKTMGGNREEEEQKEIMVVVSASSDSEPELNLVKMHRNGTNSSHPSPFLKAAVSYDIIEFCKHQNKIEALLGEWINGHLGNYSEPNKYEVEIFYQPDCENLYILNGTSEELDNKTSLYFYVKHNGEISPNLTLNYPINPTQLEISQELEYLRKKILHLELINASSTDDILLEEAAVGTSIVVVVVVTTLLVILLVCALFAFFVIKKRKMTENSHGRRCTPAVNDAYSLDSVSVFYHSLRRKSKKRASNKSLKSYLNQGFDDPNSPSRPLNFAKLTHFITDNEAIYEEFTNIPSVVPKYDEMPRGVEDKNRYANVIPVPETRVLLGGLKSTPSSEYINANTIHGPRGELRYYVATQAPLDNTVADFWQMVWEQESKVIVMLTDFVEKGIDKCADYLPPSETLDCHRVYREFQITLKSRDMREQYIVSLLQIKNLENNLVREIAHMWFTGWPQSGVPTEEKLFISFIFDVRTTRKQLRAKGPIIVHCSPGTGRTGTYIACDLCIRQFEEQRVVDIPKTVFRIRRERAGAIQTRDQYAFIYRVVNLYAAKLSTGNLDSF